MRTGWADSEVFDGGSALIMDKMMVSDDIEVAILPLVDVETIKAALTEASRRAPARGLAERCDAALSLLTASRAQAGAGNTKGEGDEAALL